MKKAYLISGILLLLSGLAVVLMWPENPNLEAVRTVSSDPQPPLEQDEIWGQQQDAVASLILSQTQAIVDQNHATGKMAHRDAHPKAHGCVKAIWNPIGSGLTAGQKVGVFANTSDPVLAWVRFSNGDPEGYDAADSNSDIRGMAIKLMTPQGSQDFVMINSPRFFSRDAKDYLDLFQSLKKGGLALVGYFARNPTNAQIINRAKIVITNVLDTSFFTPVPIKLASQSMRLKAVPCERNLLNQPKIDKSHKNFLREALVSDLKSGESCFDIFIQPNNEPKKNLIEDPTLSWAEDASPFIQVARLQIPQQDGFDSPERMNFCENLSFNPWHSDPELRPMGQINRIRRIVYTAISKYRHSLNGIPEIEPKDHNACEAETAPLCVTSTK